MSWPPKEEAEKIYALCKEVVAKYNYDIEAFLINVVACYEKDEYEHGGIK